MILRTVRKAESSNKENKGRNKGQWNKAFPSNINQLSHYPFPSDNLYNITAAEFTDTENERKKSDDIKWNNGETVKQNHSLKQKPTFETIHYSCVTLAFKSGERRKFKID